MPETSFIQLPSSLNDGRGHSGFHPRGILKSLKNGIQGDFHPKNNPLSHPNNPNES